MQATARPTGREPDEQVAAPAPPSSKLADRAGVLVAAGIVTAALANLLTSTASAPIHLTPEAHASVRAPPSSKTVPTPVGFKADPVENLSQPVSPEEAVAINAAMPFSTAPNPAAIAFDWKQAGDLDRQRALDCLTAAVYYEAGYEPLEGQEAVAQVVLNRVRHPAFPKSVCAVVYEGANRPGCQFTFACDGSLATPPIPAVWSRSRAVAERALKGFVMKGVGGATHYHTTWVAPYWAPGLDKVKQVGAHLFYRWPGAWGLPGAFAAAYPGKEPDPLQLLADAPVTPPKIELVSFTPTPIHAAEPRDETPKAEKAEKAEVTLAPPPAAPEVQLAAVNLAASTVDLSGVALTPRRSNSAPVQHLPW